VVKHKKAPAQEQELRFIYEMDISILSELQNKGEQNGKKTINEHTIF